MIRHEGALCYNGAMRDAMLQNPDRLEDGILMKGLTRRRLLSALPLACLAGVVGACSRRVVQVERVVEKEVTTVITEIVRETVIV